MNWYKKAQQIQLFRGEGVPGQEGRYYSPDKGFARQFTQSGRDEEIRTITMSISDIYRKDPLPRAYGFDSSDEPNDLDIAIQEARVGGYKAVWVDEGENEPDSVFVI